VDLSLDHTGPSSSHRAGRWSPYSQSGQPGRQTGSEYHKTSPVRNVLIRAILFTNPHPVYGKLLTPDGGCEPYKAAGKLACKKKALAIDGNSITHYIGKPNLLDYSSTKGAIVTFTRAPSNQLCGKGVGSPCQPRCPRDGE